MEKSSEKLVIYLPKEIKDALRDAAKTNGMGERGMSEEVRRRLEASFSADKQDVASRYLGALVANAANSVTDYFAPWTQNLFAYQVLQSAIRTLLETVKPQGPVSIKLNRNNIADVLFDPKDGPEKIGRSLAGTALATTPNIKPLNTGDAV